MRGKKVCCDWDQKFFNSEQQKRIVNFDSEWKKVFLKSVAKAAIRRHHERKEQRDRVNNCAPMSKEIDIEKGDPSLSKWRKGLANMSLGLLSSELLLCPCEKSFLMQAS